MNQLLLHGARVASVGAALLFVSPQSFAQQDNQNSLRGLDLDARMLEQTFPGFMGSGSGYTSRFDPSFNPAMGLIIDSLATFSEERGEEVDRFSLRSVEINLASRIDPLGWAYLVAAFDEDDFELEEAVFIMDQLPANLSIRAGKMLADFGKWNTLHLHDKNFIFEDGVREAFFGGNLKATGLEIHQWTGIGDVPVRWSMGVHSSFFGGHGEGDEPSGADAKGSGFNSGVNDNRGLEEFAFTGRATGQQDFGPNGIFQIGVSFFHTGAGLIGLYDTNADGKFEEVGGLGQTTVALDFSLRLVDSGSLTSDSLSLEIWKNQRDGLTPADEIVSRDANGIWGFYQHDFSPQWGAGVQGAWWQDALTDLGSDWFTGAESGSQRAVFVTRNFSEFNRMRLQLTQDHRVGESPSWSLALQWDVILGSHSHPLDW